MIWLRAVSLSSSASAIDTETGALPWSARCQASPWDRLVARASPDQEKQQELYQAWQDRDRALGHISRLTSIEAPHVLASEREERSDWAPNRLIQKFLEDVGSDGDDGALISGGLFASTGDATVAIMAVSLQIRVSARELIWRCLPPGGGFKPSADLAR